MEIVEKDQEIAFVDSFNDAVLSYEYEQAGFTINLIKRSVLLFNHVLNSTFIYPYGSIREINYSLPANEFDDAEICILTDDILNPIWKFRVSSNAHNICEQWVNVFNNNIFFCHEGKHQMK